MDFLRTFWLALGITFWAEMGDKTQLICLAYATEYRLRDTLLGIFWAIVLIQFSSALVGRWIGHWIPVAYLQAFSAACFFVFAIWMVFEEDEKEKAGNTWGHPIVFIGSSFLAAEAGDKTMLVAATLAVTEPWLPVGLGSSCGMFFADALALWVGLFLGKKLPRKLIKWVAVVFFFGFACWTALEAWHSFQSFQGFH